MVLNQLKIMASEKGLIDDYQQSVMLQLIAEEYRESRKSGRTGSITGFALRCKKHEDKRIKDIGEQLEHGAKVEFMGTGLPIRCLQSTSTADLLFWNWRS